MSDANILLITEDDNVEKQVFSKLVLLRDSDKIAVSNYKNALNILKNGLFAVVMVYQKDEKTLDFIKSIKSDDYEIILILDEYNRDLILSAYDIGIRDYCLLHADSCDFLIKTINCFKIKTLKDKSFRDTEFLKSSGAVDMDTGFYNYKIYKDFFVSLVIKYRNGMFLSLMFEKSGSKLSNFAKSYEIVKRYLRSDDVISLVKKNKLYVLLNNINKEGLCILLDKIQQNLPEKTSMRVGACEVLHGKTFSEIEQEANANLLSACSDNTSIIFDSNQDDWLEVEDSSKKRYKIFQNVYDNKLQNVIMPVFFRLQKSYDVKLKKVEISQYTNDSQCVFALKYKNFDAKLKLEYSGYAKINIYIEYSGLDSPENTENTISLNQLNKKYLTEIIEDFIKEFKNFIV